MFTWICQKCGTEVPPSYSECPNCAPKPEGQKEPEPVPGAPPPSLAAAPPPQEKEKKAKPVQRPGSKPALPGWLVALIVAGVITGIGALAYFYFLPAVRTRSQAATPATRLESVPATSGSPIAKHLELTGIRITEDTRKRVEVRLIVVNHSAAEIPDLELSVDLKPSNASPETKPVASFDMKVPGLGPFEAKEVVTTAKTELRAYEIPDWQFLAVNFRVMSPK